MFLTVILAICILIVSFFVLIKINFEKCKKLFLMANLKEIFEWPDKQAAEKLLLLNN